MSDNIPVKDSEMDDLKREMRSAQLMEWVESNQKNLIVGVVAVVIVLMATGLWIENDRSQRATAATIYQQAVGEADTAKKQALLDSVSRDFSGSSYGALALMQLAAVDQANAETHLNALIAHAKATEEWIWQARLDLAAIKISKGDSAAAKPLLDAVTGKQYLQSRYYLMAQASGDEAEKQQYLQKALDASTDATDAALKQKIESQMSKKAS